MSRDGHAGGTFSDIERKYEAWEKTAPAPRAMQPTYSDQPETGGTMSRLILTAIGVGIGLLLLLFATLAFVEAADWAEVARDGAQVGWNAVGFFLTVAGLGAIVATWNHNFRVLDPNRARSGGHH